jgi:hypothetical protein
MKIWACPRTELKITTLSISPEKNAGYPTPPQPSVPILIG